MHLRAPMPGMALPASLVAIGDRTDERILAMLDDEILRWTTVAPEVGEPLSTLRDLVSAGGKRLRPAFCYWAFVEPAAIRMTPWSSTSAPPSSCSIRSRSCTTTSWTGPTPDADATQCTVRTSTTTRVRAMRAASRGGSVRARRSSSATSRSCTPTSCSRPPRPRRAPVFDELRLELCVGQYLDLAGMANGPRARTRADVIERYKSGKYTVERPLHLGAALAGRLDALADGLSAFGLPLGHAFQMRDDLLGCSATRH
jgi:geranylgeranyl diphosphate synthase type I